MSVGHCTVHSFAFNCTVNVHYIFNPRQWGSTSVRQLTIVYKLPTTSQSSEAALILRWILISRVGKINGLGGANRYGGTCKLVKGLRGLGSTPAGLLSSAFG